MTIQIASSSCPGAQWIARPNSSAPSDMGARIGNADARHGSPLRDARKDKRRERLEYRLIFAVAFIVFFITAAVERVLMAAWMTRQEQRKSLFQQARESADISAAYAFMG